MKRLKGRVQKIINLGKSAGFSPAGWVFVCLFLASVLAGDPALAQSQGISPGGSPGGAASQSGSSSSSSGGGESGASGVGSALSQSPYSGSVPEGKANSEVLPITFKEAIDRALRNNLGALLGSDNTLSARGQRWHELSALLPHVSASANQSAAQIDLAAEGFRFNFAGIPKVVGPVGIWQSQVSLSQSLFDFNAIERTRGASANLQASQFAYKDARDIVVLAAGNAYLEALSGDARVETEQAQVVTAQAVYERSVDQQKAGVSPAIDALRARVELQSQQQQLIVAKNNYAKEKLSLARVIGLPPGQEFTLTDKAPYEPLAAMGVEQALQRAYTSRSDYMAAAQQLRAAEYLRRAATAEHYPALSIAGDYGDAGIRPGSSHGVFQAGITLDIPIFAGGKTHGEVLQAEAALRQTRQQLENLRGQIDQEVRTALLDLASAAEQVEVARSTVDLANQTLTQSRDRFAAGVTDNLEVVQAQESLASANESYISSLYAHNLAKVELARAIGFAEQGVRLYLQGK
jgi:outer membrane protein TolC